MKMLLKRYWLPVTGILLGALGGYLYWRFVGCATGTCPITSSPFASTVWGAAIGGLFSQIIWENLILTVIGGCLSEWSALDELTT